MRIEDQEISDHYLAMSTDDLLRIAGDRESLTIEACEALAAELGRRDLDGPEAISKYERDRDRQIQEEDAIRRSKRSRFQKGFDLLKEHPMAALLASVSSPGIAFLIGYGIITLKVGNGHILGVLVSLTLAIGGICGVAALRSSARFPIRIFGFVVALGEFFYAFVFLFAGTIGFG